MTALRLLKYNQQSLAFSRLLTIDYTKCEQKGPVKNSHARRDGVMLIQMLISTSSYSYSVMSGRSGIQDSQTSFIGCDHGKCCACFGPDSKQDYCAPKCQAINGGTVLREKDNITVWFWIRSSLPKRVWKKCMEFKEKNSAGKMETFRVEDGIRRKGPCSVPEDVTINDGNNSSCGCKRNVKVLTHKSCKQIWMSQSNKGSRVYQISVGNNQVMDVYCQMTSVSGCHGGGWTMVMKINGDWKEYFQIQFLLLEERSTYNDNAYGRNDGLDNHEYKGSTYWRASFKQICVGMKFGSRLRAFSFSYPASSLYSLIADGKYRQTRVGRAQWKSLIYGSSLQSNCNQEGFNVEQSSNYPIVKVRLGIIANQENGCDSPDSFVGLGAGGVTHNMRMVIRCRKSLVRTRQLKFVLFCNSRFATLGFFLQ
ncbi:Hypothetical predicted protein, partial [Paramuricea clavata]